VYTGTHDNAPSREWYEELRDEQRRIFWGYLESAPGESSEAAPALVRLAWSSKAALSIAPLQDLLNLGREARMNTPGRPTGNWKWRATEAMMALPAFETLGELTWNFRRAAAQDANVGR
jgi:4-alpha-glucanotransferase